MPSSLQQKGIIISGRNPITGERYYILIAKKTGFIDVWIGNTHYYYNGAAANKIKTNGKIDINKLMKDIEAKQKKQNGNIVIKRK